MDKLFLCLFFLLEAPTEPWKIFIQSREQFTCSGKTAHNFHCSFKKRKAKNKKYYLLDM